jgi:RND family efflux transporter MFP subunit
MAQGKTRFIRYLVTLSVVALAGYTLVRMFEDYLFQPWTRDGQVRAQVIKITPRVSGPIVELPIHDNQAVRKGELLFRIDPRTYELAVEQARAKLQQAKASAVVALDQAERGRELHRRDKGAISEQALIRKENKLLVADADVEVAEASLHAAILDLEFTEVRAPVDGYVTHLKLRQGTQTVANQPAVALVDAGSFWVHGFFKETQIRNIKPGNKAVVKLMTYPDQPLEGVVDNMGWGIAQQDGSTDADLLPTVNPSFDWIRLAQRIPVRIRLTQVPEGVDLRVGTTASVFVTTE